MNLVDLPFGILKVSTLASPQSKQLTLLRHASVAGNTQQRFVGSTDCQLTSLGRTEARQLADLLADQAFDLLWCSPMTRACETLDLLQASLPFGLSWPAAEFIHDLREIDFGRWENLTFDELQQQDPDAISLWHEQEDDFTFPGGESIRSFFGRIDGLLQRISDGNFRSLLMVTHGGVIRHLLCRLLGHPTDQSYAFKIPPASFTQLEIQNGQATLVSLAKSPRMGTA